jgi:hypothetical protein
MAYQANVLKVMIASPGDVAEEREIVTREIYRWNDAHAETRRIVLQPVKWETSSTPRLGQSAQAELNEQFVESADILIGIFGTRIGTPTVGHVSGTVEEIKNHVGAGKTAKVYFSDAPVQPSTIDPTQYKALQEFKEECKGLGLYATYTDTTTFERDFKQHLDIELNAARYHWLPLTLPASGSPALSQPTDDSMALLTLAAQGQGIIWMQPDDVGERIVVGDRTFTDGTARSAARWKDAVTQLSKFGYAIEQTPGTGRVELTNAGYGAADKAENSKPFHIAAEIAGPAGGQVLEVSASKPIILKKIDYLHSTDACITSQPAGVTGKELKVPFEYNRVLELSNSGRPDKDGYDHSGPVKLRLIFEVDGKSRYMILPAHLQPRTIANKKWMMLTGSAETTIQ